MNAHIKKVYVPMTETGFYILLCLGEENHCYGIISKMEKDGLIAFVREEDKRKLYRLTDLGRQVLELESRRIERLYRNMREVRGDEL